MIRVHKASGLASEEPWRDVDANTATPTPSGALILAQVEVRQVRPTGPDGSVDLTAAPRAQISNPQLVEIIADGYWSRAENLDLGDDGAEIAALAASVAGNQGGTLQ